MRNDALGFFWRDEPIVRERKEKVKPTPPEPVWLLPSYLPHLGEALRFNVSLFTDQELITASQEGLLTGINHELIFDIECYWNYFLIAFLSPKTKKVLYFEMCPGQFLDTAKLKWMITRFRFIGFNSIVYDIVLTALALNGFDNQILKEVSDSIIQNGLRPYEIYKSYKTKKLEVDHIDLIQVSPLSASLKIYGGRLHAKRMQDLPFDPETVLNDDQIAITRWYCLNDLDNTEMLYNALEEELALRSKMSIEYRSNLMSKSDAQVAEAVIAHGLKQFHSGYLRAPAVDLNCVYRYSCPDFIQYQTPLMNWALGVVTDTPFVATISGKIGTPPQIKKLKLTLGKTEYQMGIGGLHSCEEIAAHVSDSEFILKEYDVTSYYPRIILNQKLYPKHLGSEFLGIYQSIVERRLEAKRTGNKVVADSLKITINGSFGKFGNKYSILYSPSLVIQVTMTGQLSLLMLIESIELIGISVVSANTDGIVVKCPRNREHELEPIIKDWQRRTDFQLEEEIYDALYSKSVNNYIAIKKEKSGTKNKGEYNHPGLQVNPTSEICITAIEDYLLRGIDIDYTILSCPDITQFVTVRTVNGGAVKDGNYLGKAIRWYYAKDETGVIVYAKSGNKVPRSMGAKPLMDMPEVFPNDIDYNWYITETKKMMENMGYDFLKNNR